MLEVGTEPLDFGKRARTRDLVKWSIQEGAQEMRTERTPKGQKVMQGGRVREKDELEKARQQHLDTRADCRLQLTGCCLHLDLEPSVHRASSLNTPTAQTPAT